MIIVGFRDYSRRSPFASPLFSSLSLLSLPSLDLSLDLSLVSLLSLNISSIHSSKTVSATAAYSRLEAKKTVNKEREEMSDGEEEKRLSFHRLSFVLSVFFFSFPFAHVLSRFLTGMPIVE